MSEVLVIGLASLYVWYLLAQATITEWVFSYPREHWGALWSCSFCAGFWITGAITLATGYDVLTHLAAAAVVGVLGSHTE